MCIINNADALVRVRQEQRNDVMRAAAQQRLIHSARLQSPNVWARLAQRFEMTRAKLSPINPQPFVRCGRGETRPAGRQGEGYLHV